jgi:hypothetical protein
VFTLLYWMATPLQLYLKLQAGRVCTVVFILNPEGHSEHNSQSIVFDVKSRLFHQGPTTVHVHRCDAGASRVPITVHVHISVTPEPAESHYCTFTQQRDAEASRVPLRYMYTAT